MNDKKAVSPPPGMTLEDILYVLFRHKWKIGIIVILAVIAAGGVYFLRTPMYKSEARLLIKYVVDAKNPAQMGNSSVTTLGDRGDTALNTELQVLSSFDLAVRVANDLGPSNILAKVGGGTNEYAAAGAIQRGLVFDVPKGSTVIHLIFQHPDPAIVQPVLKSLTEEYYKRHVEIHREIGEFGEFLTAQTDQLHSRLLQTEEALRAAKTNAGVISIEDTKRVYGDQIARIRTEILEAEADLVERQAAAAEMAKLTHTATPVFTNEVTAASTNDAPVPPQKADEYKRLCSLIDKLSARQQELSVQFTPENSWVKQVDEQIAANEKAKAKLEEAYPTLAATKVSSAKQTGPTPQMDMVSELAKVSGLQSKIKLLNQQLNDIQNAATKMYASEASISDLQRKYYLQETQYNYFSMNLEQSRIDDAVGASRLSNISQIQLPTPPQQDSGKSLKTALMILAGGVGLAFSLAFLLEFYFDKSIKRPIEVETKLGFPLFMSIPLFSNLSKNGRLKGAKIAGLIPESSPGRNGEAKPSQAASNPVGATSANGSGPNPPAKSSDGSLAPWDPRYILRPFCEALRDSLITFFEINNLTHKPKLIAVTSCSEGAGVSTLAAGLAASLSETGEGNVLLVNMNQTDGSIHQFRKGDLACDLDEVLEAETRGKALVQENLYVATEAVNGDKLPVVFPNRFKNLVPRLRASDYDYIIFDMPAVNQITSTQRLARFMDMVLMVVESEKTDRDRAKRASSMLGQSKTNVGIILNKRRNYLPKRFRQDF